VNAYQSFLPEQEEMSKAARAQATALANMVRRTNEAPSFRWLTDEMKRHQELIRVALGPVEDLKRLGELHSFFADNFNKASVHFGDITDNFRLPALAEIKSLLHKFDTSVAAAVPPASQLYCKSFEHDELLQRAIEAMRTPWINQENPFRSIAGFAGLQEIGFQLHRHPAFDPAAADILRSALGDWRLPVALPTNVFDDIAARTTLYGDRGLNPALTAFPAEAFKQGLSIAGLRRAPPPFVTPYLTDIDTDGEDADQEIGFHRTNAAHRRLLRFETQLRQFIDDRMKASFGEHWIKHNVPGSMRQAWQDKKQVARANGEPDQPLIAYADFTDYVPIITQRNNWAALFSSVFGRAELVKESFQRLYPIRRCAMHARIITQDDELYLHVETMRLLKAIGVWK